MLAEDGRLAVDYAGTLVLSSTDARVTLSSLLDFTSNDAGYRSTQLTLKTSGTQKITLQDPKKPELLWSSEITVEAASLSSLSFKVGPASQVTLASPIPIEIVAADSYGNPVKNTATSSQVQLGLVSSNSAALGGTAAGMFSGDVLTLSPTVDKIGTGYSLTASILGSALTSATSSTFSVLGPSLTLAPVTLAFGSVGIGTTSSALVLTLTNHGNLAASSCSSPTLGGSHSGDFSITGNDCGSSDLAAGSSCTVTLTASPTASGTRTATLTRTCTNGGDLSTTSNGISATGVGATLAFSPTSYDFRKVQLRSPNASSVVFTLSNSGAGVASGCSAPALSGNQSSDYSIDGDGCGTAGLAPGSSCTVTVRPAPTSTGSRTATLSRTCTTGGTASTTSNGLQVNGVRFRPKAISVGNGFVCSILGDGSVVCWGRNASGQLGIDSTTNVGDATTSVTTATPVNLGLGKTAVAIATGSNHACAILNNGDLKCWGSNALGELGQDNDTGVGCGTAGGCTLVRNLAAINLGLDTNGSSLKAIKVAAGASVTCALLQNGKIKCWGFGGSGQLGQDSTTNIGCGAGNSCALMSSLNAIVFNAASVGTRSTDIALGTAGTACALMENGKVVCWGSNTNGLLGAAAANSDAGCGGVCTAMNSLDPVDLPGGGVLAKKIAVGTSHACALLTDGSIRCWGANGSGQLGIDNIIPAGGCGACGALANVNLVFNNRDVAAGDGRTCSVTTEGKTWCWGNNGSGQLGFNNTTNIGDGLGDSMMLMVSNGPINFGAVTSPAPRSISAWGSTTCALLDSGEVKCWGLNTDGELGTDSATAIGCGAGGGCGLLSTSTAVNLGTENRALKVETSGQHTCALLTNGELTCWGRNSSGELGLNHTQSVGTNSGSLATLTSVNIGTNKKALDFSLPRSTDLGYTCTISTRGGVRCWGDNSTGQLGQNSLITTGDSAGEMDSLTDVPDLAGGGSFGYAAGAKVGSGHTCALNPDGYLICWGKNTVGQSGQENSTTYGAASPAAGGLAPVSATWFTGNIPLDGRVVKIEAGTQHTCVLTHPTSGADPAVRCFGAGSSGQLGRGSTDDAGSSAIAPNNMALVQNVPVSNPVEVAAGGNSSCIIASDRALICWGDNSKGQLGINSSDANKGSAGGDITGLSAIQVGNTRVLQASISPTHACAITTDHDLRCWGDNTIGNLGIDHTTAVSDGVGASVASLSAIDLGTDRKALQVSTGQGATCALLDNGEIKCWGDNTYGQLGIESTETSWGDNATSHPMSALPVVKLP
jgi:alpha-tubulin suppressor-like RCC1 family protein